jgi:predicted alpha/beta hydrolase family esterase
VLRVQLPGWTPIVRQRLPFRSLLVGSRDDPYCSFERAQALAADWGAEFRDMGHRGHLNSDSGLADWPEGHAMLLTLQQESH